VIGNVNSLPAASNLAEDGVFGPATTAAVKAVQQLFGITRDGIVGPQTWSVLVTGSAP
jgi:peptidoglycan hydrolase-like protein with peptidoglycan-binding domain